MSDPRQQGFCADVVAVAKTPLRSGAVLDGEGGFAVRGKLIPADESLRRNALSIGLAHFPLVREVAEGDIVTWDDVEVRADPQVLRLRQVTAQLPNPDAPRAKLVGGGSL
jgi:predicted homoserine dehydrogenase-like protein